MTKKLTFLGKIWKGIVIAWNWLVYSSENADKISLMVKGIGVTLIPVILIATHLFNVDLTDVVLKGYVDKIVNVIIVASGAVGVIATAVGAIRKIWTSFAGTNEVVAKFGGYKK